MILYPIVVVFLYVASDFGVYSDSSKDVNEAEINVKPSNDYISTPDMWEMNPPLKSLWVYRPPSSLIRSQQNDDESQQVVFKPPHVITRLAKPLTFGFDPGFHKGYFEPFERRQKPVTLVTFRKNGLQPRSVVNPSSQSAEVAELQSAFNEVTSLWHDVPDLMNL